MSQKAVILFNLGGPDSLDAVRPFLFNLFSDKAIIRLPNPLRYFLARLISNRRTHEAQEIYHSIGGGSPLLPNTQAQARALQELLGPDYFVTVIMRYWHPRAAAVIRELAQKDISEVILLPLYPQFSTSTTESSFQEFKDLMARKIPQIKIREIGCYPLSDGVIQGYTQLMLKSMEQKTWESYRVLFTAHGLPEKFVTSGDPYQFQVEQTVGRLMASFPINNVDYQICYQSRVGPLKWIGPATDDEIKRAALEDKNIILVPISFVSEHSETLYELDLQYGALAQECGVKDYIRVPALGTSPEFIKSLKELVLKGASPLAECQKNFSACGCRGAA